MAAAGHDASDIDNLQASEIGGLALENARQYQSAVEQSRTDSLTGLPNRRAFDEWTTFLPRQPFAILALDIDGLKGANDRFGHAVGDELI